MVLPRLASSALCRCTRTLRLPFLEPRRHTDTAVSNQPLAHGFWRHSVFSGHAYPSMGHGAGTRHPLVPSYITLPPVSPHFSPHPQVTASVFNYSSSLSSESQDSEILLSVQHSLRVRLAAFNRLYQLSLLCVISWTSGKLNRLSCLSRCSTIYVHIHVTMPAAVAFPPCPGPPPNRPLPPLPSK